MPPKNTNHQTVAGNSFSYREFLQKASIKKNRDNLRSISPLFATTRKTVTIENERGIESVSIGVAETRRYEMALIFSGSFQRRNERKVERLVTPDRFVLSRISDPFLLVAFSPARSWSDARGSVKRIVIKTNVITEANRPRKGRVCRPRAWRFRVCESEARVPPFPCCSFNPLSEGKFSSQHPTFTFSLGEHLVVLSRRAPPRSSSFDNGTRKNPGGLINGAVPVASKKYFPVFELDNDLKQRRERDHRR